MTRKTIIVAPALAKRSKDDRTLVLSPNGAVHASPGRESGVGEALQNSGSPRGATHRYLCRPSGASTIQKGLAIPGLNALGYYLSSLRDLGVPAKSLRDLGVPAS